jgi:hypothetical protein
MEADLRYSLFSMACLIGFWQGFSESANQDIFDYLSG